MSHKPWKVGRVNKGQQTGPFREHFECDEVPEARCKGDECEGCAVCDPQRTPSIKAR